MDASYTRKGNHTHANITQLSAYRYPITKLS